MGGDDCADKPLSTIQAHTIATGRTVDLNFSSIGLEVLCWILRGDSALDRESTNLDFVLGQSELWEENARSDLNLSRHNVNARDFLCRGKRVTKSRVSFNDVRLSLN